VDQESGSKPELETTAADADVLVMVLTALGTQEVIAFEKRCVNHRFTAHDRELLATLVTVPAQARRLDPRSHPLRRHAGCQQDPRTGPRAGPRQLTGAIDRRPIEGSIVRMASPVIRTSLPTPSRCSPRRRGERSRRCGAAPLSRWSG